MIFSMNRRDCVIARRASGESRTRRFFQHHLVKVAASQAVSRKLQCAGHQILTTAEIRKSKLETRIELPLSACHSERSEESPQYQSIKQLHRFFASLDEATLPIFTFEFRISSFDFPIS